MKLKAARGFCFFISLSCVTIASELPTLIDSYQKDVQRIDEEYQTKIELVKTNYVKSLETVLSKIQATGNLEKTLAVKTEVERFYTVGTVSKSPSSNLLPEISASQEKLRKEWVLLKQARVIALGQRSVKQDESLGVLIQNLTKDGKLDDALAVKTEQDSIKKTIQDYKIELLDLKKTDASSTTAIAKGAAETNTISRLRQLTSANNNDDRKFAIGLYKKEKTNIKEKTYFIQIREDGTATHNGRQGILGTWKIDNAKAVVSFADGSVYSIPLIKDATTGSLVEVTVLNNDGSTLRGIYKKVE